MVYWRGLVENGAIMTGVRGFTSIFFAVASFAAGPKRVAVIDFFGYGGLDTNSVRLALPFREGDRFPSRGPAIAAWKENAKRAVLRVTGRPATDVAMVCCNERGDWMIYIGLSGSSAKVLKYNPAPAGGSKLPEDLVLLDRELNAAWSTAVRRGNSREERATGYALSTDAELRSRQLSLRELALRYEERIFDVLATSSDESQRAIAATALGYARQTDEQINALVRAASDPGGEVRNNAVRALGVLADARPDLRKKIPAQVFIDLVRSGLWTDRNKGSFLLLSLTQNGDDFLLAELRSHALESLSEMARWRFSGHAHPAVVLLERIAGKRS